MLLQGMALFSGRMRTLVLFVLILVGGFKNAAAYNHRRCFGKPGVPAAHIFTSTTQFTSSWGDCRAIGMQDEREQFIAINQDLLTIQAATGHGEHVTALAALSGCRTDGAAITFGTELKGHFQTIFYQGRYPRTAQGISAEIDHVIRTSPVLRTACQRVGQLNSKSLECQTAAEG